MHKKNASLRFARNCATKRANLLLQQLKVITTIIIFRSLLTWRPVQECLSIAHDNPQYHLTPNPYTRASFCLMNGRCSFRYLQQKCNLFA